MIIPDSIEPIEGWKVLSVYNSGDTAQLVSPSCPAYWPLGNPIVASCVNVPVRWKWLVSHDEPPTTDAEVEVLRSLPVAGNTTGAPRMLTASVATHSAMMGQPVIARQVGKDHIAYVPDRPSTHLVRGNWVMKKVRDEHHSPEEGCSCGIYMVNDPAQALGYGSHAIKALVRVKGWGKTIPASGGARVEKAYPSAIYMLNASMPEVARNYGIDDYYEASDPESLLAHLDDPRNPLKRGPELVTDAGQVICPCGCGAAVPPGAAPHSDTVWVGHGPSGVKYPVSQTHLKKESDTLWRRFVNHMNS